MTNERMTKDERATAVMAFGRATKIIEELKHLHKECEELVDLGWDLDAWDVSRAAMDIGAVGMAIADIIGYEDGWRKDKEETK